MDGTPEGAAIGRRLQPDRSDYFVLKPRHSGFYGTPLEMLLECLGVTRLVLAGTTTNSCVWFTAADAHVRGYVIVVAADATVALDDELERCSLHLMQSTLGAEVLPAARIDFTAREG
jgi:nicotinamidase-related amidase